MDKKIGIIGGSQGIGKWLVGYLQEKGASVKYSSNDSSSQYISNVQLVTDSEIVIIAVPISAMEPVLEEIFPYLEDKLCIDVCSVKSGIVEKYKALCATYHGICCPFLSIHPMFAPTISSISGQTVIFNFESEHGLGAAWRTLLQEDGTQVVDLDYVAHDKTMGVIQGLNHFNVFVSAKTLSKLAIELDMAKQFSSPTYRIFIIFFTRYVMQNPRLYAEIQLFNPYVKEVVQLFMDEAKQLLQTIEEHDIQRFEQYVISMQDYYAGNLEDTQLSNYLIDQLGQYVAEKNKTPKGILVK